MQSSTPAKFEDRQRPLATADGERQIEKLLTVGAEGAPVTGIAVTTRRGGTGPHAITERADPTFDARLAVCGHTRPL